MSSSPDSDRAFIQRSVRRAIIAVVVVVTTLALLWLLKSALTPLVAAFTLAYLLDPVIDWFEQRRVPRSAGICLLLGLWFVAMLGLGLVVVPRLSSEVATIAEHMPGYVDQAIASFGPRLETWFGLELPGSIREGIDEFRARGFELPVEPIRQVLEGLLASVTGTLGSIVGLLVIPVIAYYALVEFDRIKVWFLELVPAAYREAVHERASTINTLISGFIRGQLIVCGILGILYAGGFLVIGIDMAVGIGLIAGALAIIPYVGSAAALAMASILCLLQYGVDVHLALVVGWYALVQTLEGMFLTPRIVGRSVGIHPVAVIVGLLIGGDLLGFLGLLVAVPLTSVVQVFARELLDAYRDSELYRGESA